MSPRIELQRGPDFIVRSMRSANPVCLSSAVMRTAALPEVCFEAADEVCGDFVLFLRIALDWDVGFLATPGVELRRPRRSALERLRQGRHAHGAEGLQAPIPLGERGTPGRRARRSGALPAATPRRAMSLRVDRGQRVPGGGHPGPSPCVRDRPQLVLAPRIWRTAARSSLGPRRPPLPPAPAATQ